jgi:hypothetical protein
MLLNSVTLINCHAYCRRVCVGYTKACFFLRIEKYAVGYTKACFFLRIEKYAVKLCDPDQLPKLSCLLQEGARGLYKGFLLSNLSIIPYLSVSLSAYDTLKVRSEYRCQKEMSHHHPAPFSFVICIQHAQGAMKNP